jgi:hypothetical protein
MATVRKTLVTGARTAAAATDGVLYTVPGATDAVVSSIVIAETNGVATTVKVCTDSGGATTTAAARAVAWNMALGANQTIVLALGITLAAGSTIVFASASGNVTFTAFGQENT